MSNTMYPIKKLVDKIITDAVANGYKTGESRINTKYEMVDVDHISGMTFGFYDGAGRHITPTISYNGIMVPPFIVSQGSKVLGVTQIPKGLFCLYLNLAEYDEQRRARIQQEAEEGGLNVYLKVPESFPKSQGEKLRKDLFLDSQQSMSLDVL